MFSIHCILYSTVVIHVLIEPDNTEWFVLAALGHMTPAHSWVEIKTSASYYMSGAPS